MCASHLFCVSSVPAPPIPSRTSSLGQFVPRLLPIHPITTAHRPSHTTFSENPLPSPVVVVFSHLPSSHFSPMGLVGRRRRLGWVKVVGVGGRVLRTLHWNGAGAVARPPLFRVRAWTRGVLVGSQTLPLCGRSNRMPGATTPTRRRDGMDAQTTPCPGLCGPCRGRCTNCTVHSVIQHGLTSDVS